MKATLVLVDDEPSLLRLMKTYLGRMGYLVHACENGKCAEAAFLDNKIDAMVVDLTLPDISGEELTIQLANKHPDLRVLVCSGYPFNLDSLPASIRVRCASLQKPFLPNMLAECVEKLLQR